jgi:hypothetical protein
MARPQCDTPLVLLGLWTISLFAFSSCPVRPELHKALISELQNYEVQKMRAIVRGWAQKSDSVIGLSLELLPSTGPSNPGRTLKGIPYGAHPYPIQKVYSPIFGQIIILKRVICKVSLFHPLSPLSDPQSKEILGMKCWNSAFNAQRSKVIIIVVQVAAVQIYIAAVQALRKKETQDETQFTTKW